MQEGDCRMAAAGTAIRLNLPILLTEVTRLGETEIQ